MQHCRYDGLQTSFLPHSFSAICGVVQRNVVAHQLMLCYAQAIHYSYCCCPACCLSVCLSVCLVQLLGLAALTVW